MITITRNVPTYIASDLAALLWRQSPVRANDPITITAPCDSCEGALFGEWRGDACDCDASALVDNAAWCEALSGALTEAARCSTEYFDSYVGSDYFEYTEALCDDTRAIIAGLLGTGGANEVHALSELSTGARNWIKVRALWAVSNLGLARCDEAALTDLATEIEHGGYDPDEVESMRAALRDMEKVYNFCRADYYLPYEDTPSTAAPHNPKHAA